eukprot:TRINITY_DN23434_c0_g1_i1.p1 TRINITY_DN23434_c0_g1~~TRINITY_DN23434_c0_g1_i1.p1  ORF type:complete len:141 (-),score=28.80 TRINITY_DN23434_c0_g1_i1:35-457(-)
MDERVPILVCAREDPSYCETTNSEGHGSIDSDTESEPSSSSLKSLLYKLGYSFFGLLIVSLLSQLCLLSKALEESIRPVSVLISLSLLFYILLASSCLFISFQSSSWIMDLEKSHVFCSALNWTLLLLVIFNIAIFIFMV